MDREPSMRRWGVFVVVVALALGACSGSDGDPDGAPTEDAATAAADDATTPSEDPTATATGEPDVAGAVTFVGTDEVTWEATEMTAPVGLVRLVVSCGATAPHTIAIEDVRGGAALAGCSGGGDDNDEVVELEPGTYTFFCTIGNHREQGMEGTLTVG
jgi:plastocyanin